jgi:hypothetical protein
MNRIKTTSLAGLTWLWACVSWAEDGSFPLYKGKLLDPKCVTRLTMGDGYEEGKISLADCSKDPGRVQRLPDGTVKYTGPKEELFGRPYDSYKVLGRYGEIFLMQYDWNGGGTGYFTGLIGVRIDGDLLVRVYSAVDGDKCNRGLSKAWKEDGKILAEVALTPWDLIALVPAGKVFLKQDGRTTCTLVSGHHGCCGASATFRIDPLTGEETLLEVDLGDYPMGDEGEKDCQYQGHFNRVFDGHIHAKNTKLDPKGVEAFFRKFKALCAQGSASDPEP